MTSHRLKRTLEYLRKAELEFLENAVEAGVDEQFLAVKSELDEFRNVVWSHLASASSDGNAASFLEALRMRRIVAMLRKLNYSQRRMIANEAENTCVFADIADSTAEVCVQQHM